MANFAICSLLLHLSMLWPAVCCTTWSEVDEFADCAPALEEPVDSSALTLLQRGALHLAPAKPGNSSVYTPIVGRNSFAPLATELQIGRSENAGQLEKCGEYPLLVVAKGMCAVGVVFLGLGMCARACANKDPQQVSSGQTQPQASKGSVQLEHVGAIDGLRAVGLVCISLLHLGSDRYPKWTPYIIDGHIFPQFFFVASGFVNFRSVHNHRDRFDCKSGLIFIQRRMARIAPMFWFALLMSIIIIKVYFPYSMELCSRCSPAGLLKETTFLFTVTNPKDMPLNQIDWFLNTLLILNMGFPVLYNLCPSNPIAIFCCLLLTILLRSSFPFFGYQAWLNYVTPLARLPEFVAGILSAALVKRLPSHAISWCGWGWVFDASIALVVFLQVKLRHFGDTSNSGDFCLTGLWCIACIAASAAAEAPFPLLCSRLGILGRTLNCAPLQFLAKYGLHFYVMQAPLLLWPPVYEYELNKVFGTVPMIILGGVLAAEIIDVPIQRLLDSTIKWMSLA